MRKLIYLSMAVCTALAFGSTSVRAQDVVNPQNAVLNSRVSVNTIPASGLDYTQNEDYTGNVSLPLPLVSLGSETVELKYYSQGIANKIRTNNEYAPSGEVGLGWQLLYGSISGEINGSLDTSDDKYYYDGPNGSYELVEGADGIFRIPNYKPWQFQRVMHGDTLAGWIVSKPNGTILRFGNYDATSGFMVSYGTTNATRFFLGVGGIVTNPSPSQYQYLGYIPYEWDLSEIQDVKGDETTLDYRQIQAPLITNGISSATYGWEYTKESHLSRITNNEGQEVDFSYSLMDSDQYYNYSASYNQNLEGTVYLDSIRVYGNTLNAKQLYRQIVLSYDTADIMGLGISKMYLVGLTTEGADGDTLPSYVFQYDGLNNDVTGEDPGALMSVTDPKGATVTYTYSQQPLTSFSLSESNEVNAIDYWDIISSGTYYRVVPRADGLAGKDFVCVPMYDDTTISNTLYPRDSVMVYRRESSGWVRDTGFPDSLVYRVVTGDNYTVWEWAAPDSGGFVRVRTRNGWSRYDVATAILNQDHVTGNDFNVLGCGPNYFVVEHNEHVYSVSNEPQQLYWNVSVVMITPTGLKVYELPGTFWDAANLQSGSDNEYYDVVRAYCGNNLAVIKSFSPEGGSKMYFNYASFSNSQNGWTVLGTDSTIGAVGDQASAFVGKNFVACQDRSSGMVKVYLRNGDNIETADQIQYTVDPYSDAFVLGSDYYAFACLTSDLETVAVRTWNGTGFSETDLTSLNSSTLATVGNNLIISWTQSSPAYRKLGYMTFYPSTSSFGSLTTMDSSAFGNTVPGSDAVGINQSTFAELWYQTQDPGYYAPSAYLRLYEFRGNSFVGSAVDSLPLTDVTANGTTVDEDPALWVMQPGDDFIAISRHGQNGGQIVPPDSLDLFTFSERGDGTLQFTGNPTVPVLSQTTVEDGRDHSATYDYAFTDGILNHYLTAEFENVTETLPGANGSISTSYYVDKDSTANGINYKFLEGYPYQVVDYNSSGLPVKSVENTWDAVGVDPTNGVYDQELLSKIDSLDGVKDTTTYSYDGGSGDYLLTEEIQSDGNGVERITHLQHPLDYPAPTSNGDAMSDALYNMRNVSNDVSPVIEKWVVSDSLGSFYVASANLTTYEVAGSGQILPYQSMRFFAEDPQTASQFVPSTVAVTGTGVSTFSYDSRYLPEETFDGYNQYGYPLETTDANGIATGYEYGYGGSTLMGVVKNSGGGPYLFDDFNDGSISDNDPFTWQTSADWSDSAQTLKCDYGQYAQVPIVQSQNFTADVRIRILNYSSSTDWAGIVFGNQTNTPFGSGYLVFIRANGNVSFFNGTPDTTISEVAAGASYGQWHRLTVSVNGTNVQIFVDGKLQINETLSTAPSSGYITLYDFGTEVQFDDFRCYPYGSLASSYGYDPVTLELTNKNGPNNIPTYYTYDSFQRLSTVQNDQNQVVKSLRYYLAGSSISYGNPNWTATTLYRDATDSTTTTTYFDGLGRNIQTETEDGAEPIVAGTKYDQMNRDSVTYKPFLSSTGSGYVTGYMVDYYDQNYYNANVYDGFSDSYPYSTNLYYPDPLGRIEDMVPPGAPWQSRPINYVYGTNATGEVSGYSAGSLYKTTITDENLVKKLEYKDKFGNLVETEADSGGLDLMTTFEYDVLGNMTESTSPAVYATDYSYNTLGQLTQKNSPDAGTTQYLYDNNGNLRFIKDADHNGATDASTFASNWFSGPGSQTAQFTVTMPTTMEIDLWTDMNYSGDVETAVLEAANGTQLLTFSCDDADGDQNSAVLYIPAGTYKCIITGNDGDGFNYDIYPNGNYEFVYRKYDAFNRLTQEGMFSGSTASGDFTQANADNENVPNESGGYNAIFRRAYYYDTPSPDANAKGQTNIQGRLSYTESYGVNGNLIMRTSYSYDDMGRVAWIVQTGLTPFSKVIYYTCNLQGQVTEKDYYDNSTPADSNNFSGTYSWLYSYDAAGRLNNAEGANAFDGGFGGTSFTYFASGKLQQLGQASGVTVNYHYNQRDWLTSDSSADFWEHIGYDSIAELGSLEEVTPKYNGDITWDTYYINGLTYTDPSTNNSTDLVGYAFLYDNANRLTWAGFGYSPSPGSWASSGPYSMYMNYDNDGDVSILQRNGGSGSMVDNLTYDYRPGTHIDTLITNATGNPGSVYTYDSNGNVISDSRDNVGFTLYDTYNRPETIYKEDGTVIQYRYDPNGLRVEKEVGSTSNYYFRGKDGNPEVLMLDPESENTEFFTFANGNSLGEVTLDTTNGGEPYHYYYIKDHLGNIRVIVDMNGTVDAMNDYYPFGETMRSQVNSGPDPRYQFISKELDAETGLYHLGARSYDPWSGRFLGVDPLAVLSPAESPYAYVFDNPIGYSDPFGLDTMYTQMPNNNGGYAWVSNWIPDNIVTPQNQGQQSGSLVTLQEMLNEEQAYVDRIQRQADKQAKAETKQFYHGFFKGTANVADKVSESQNYSIAGEALMGQEEAIPLSFAIGETADVVSTVAKGLDILTGGPASAFIDQVGKTAVNLSTLRILSTTEAGARLANDPVFRTAVKMTLEQIAPK